MSDDTMERLVERLEDLEVNFLSSGDAMVMNLHNGRGHLATLTSCDCEDFARRNGGTYDGLCKHILARRLMEPCPICGQRMHVDRLDNFVCEVCGYAVMGSIVRTRRQEAMA